MKMSKYLPILMLVALASAASAQDWGQPGIPREYGSENKLVQKVYSVADLVIPIDSANQPACAATGCAAPTQLQHPTVYAKQLIKQAMMVKPDSWDACGGCGKIDYYPIGHALIVHQTPEVQQQVAELLASLRKLPDTQITMQLLVLRVSPELRQRFGLPMPTGKAPVADSKPVVWNDKQVRMFLQAVRGDSRCEVLNAPTLTTLNGQTGMVEVSQTKHFLTGVKIEDFKGQLIFSPENKPHFIGTRCEIQAVVQENGKAVGLRFKLNMAEEYGPAELVPISTKITPVFENGVKGKPEPFTQYLQSPRIQTIDVARNATVPANGTLVLPAETFTKEVPNFPNQIFMGVDFSKLLTHKVTENIVVLVTPRIVVQPAAEVKEVKTSSCLTGVGCNRSSGVVGSVCAEPSLKPAASAGATPKQIDEVITLRHVGAADAVIAVQGFFTNVLSGVTSGPQGSSPGAPPSVVLAAEPVTNSVLVSAPAEWLPRVLQMIERLDMPPAQASAPCAIPDSSGWTTNTSMVASCCQVDCERLQYILKRALSKANIEVISSGHGVVLTGTVARAEDIDTVMRIAGGVLGKQAAEKVINALSVGEQQVQLDVTVARVDRSKLAPRLGSGAKTTSGSIVGGLVAPNGDAGKVVHGIVPAKAQDLLNALRTAGIAKLLAEPKLVTQSGRPARFLSGGRQAILGTASGIDGPGVIFEEFGTEIEFLPIVYANGKIYLEVATRVRGVNPGLGITTCTSIIPGFDEQSVRTTVVLESGQTFAIGGMILTGEQSSATKISMLGDLPFIDRTFQVVKQTESEQELVILVTPRLVEPMSGLVANESASKCPPCCKEQVAMSPQVKPAACCHEKSPAMNLADVVALSSSGVSDEIINLQIEMTGAKFKLATEDILWLKKNKVSDNVVMKMQFSGRRQEPTPPATVQPVDTPAYSTQPSAPAQYFPPPLPPTPAYYPARSMGPVPLSVPYSVPYKLNGAYPPAMPPCAPMAAPSPTTLPYSYGSPLQFTPLYRSDSNGFERIGIDFGTPAPATPKPVSLDFGFPYPLTGVTGTVIVNERNLDIKRAQSKQAGEIGEAILGATAEIIDGVATFAGEELPAMFADASENLNPKVTVTVGVGVKFGKNDSDKPK